MESKEQRIRATTSIYYSRPEIQKAIFSFSQNRETVPRYYEGFGKRPDALQYPGDVFQFVKKGATSFHCSEELWSNPLDISSQGDLDELRTGWDLLIDIDCKWFDFSKIAAQAIINVLKAHRIKGFGVKFSGSKGFHIIVPWKSFPKQISGGETCKLFPEVPRKIAAYIRFKAEEEMNQLLPDDFYNQFKNTKINRGKKCNTCKEISLNYVLKGFSCPKCDRKETKKILSDSKDRDKKFRCPDCTIPFEIEYEKDSYECRKCGISFEENPSNFSRSIEVDLFDLMGLDLILVSPRHLFRAPYSLHEKTALASVVLTEEEISNFQPRDADPMKVEIHEFLPEPEEGEARELLMQALDWYRENKKEEKQFAQTEFSPIKIENLSDSFLPPSIRKILEGVDDGRKRALFVLINLFRSIGMEKEEMEKRISDWNGKNKVPLKEGYVKSQIVWSMRNKVVPPPNFDKDYYKGIGVTPNEEELRLKNPVNYVVKKSSKKQNTKDNFKN